MIERPAFLDLKNAGLLTALVLVVLLAVIIVFGPLSTAVESVEKERQRYVEKVEELEQRTGSLKPLSIEERARLSQFVARLQKQTIQLGVNPESELAEEVSRLLERTGIRGAQVIIKQNREAENGDEDRGLIEVALLEGGTPFKLVPHSVQAQLRSDFPDLRRALDRLADPAVPVQLERLTLVRQGNEIHATVSLVYWSREERS